MRIFDDEDKQYFTAMGNHFGYPKCCIDAFCNNHTLNCDEEEADVRIEASENTGFVPCLEHAKKINSKEITLVSLIEDRNHPEEFPNSKL